MDLNIEKIKKKRNRIMDISDELEHIEKLERELDFMEIDADKEKSMNAFGFFWHHDGINEPKGRFAFNGLHKYTNLTKNIIALTRVELDKRKKEIQEELKNDFGGIPID